jgi:hypothetical protein
LKGRFDDGGSSILIRPPARLPSFFMGINKLWLRALALALALAVLLRADVEERNCGDADELKLLKLQCHAV